ncbi:MAG: type IV conjugative transfer system lipoprotein TraV [Wenzhouxiangellaceae bacterium]
MNKPLFAFLAVALLAGCVGNPRYACGLPDGVGCKPVGAVYEASVAGTLGSTRTRGRLTRHEEDGNQALETSERSRTEAAEAPVVATLQPGDPLLTRPRHIRVWINRWEDATGDLHDETYLYLRLDNGAWRLGQ